MAQSRHGSPVTVAVLGSCMTRDVFNSRFNPDYKSMWQCNLLQNQASLISMMSPAYPLADEDLGEHVGDYNKMQVRNDTSREFLTRLVHEQPDYLIVDFFADVHFGVLDLGEGQFVTNNRWTLHRTHWYERRKEADELRALRLQDDPEAYLALWRAALDRLVELVRRDLPGTTVVVHRGRNVERWLAEGRDRPMPMRRRPKLFKIDVKQFNRDWRLLDDLASAVDGWEQIDLTDREYRSFQGHPWGVFYVHYTFDYHDEFLAALNAIHLERCFDEGSPEWAMVRQVRQARSRAHRAAGESVAEHDRLRAELARLRAEVTGSTRPEAGLPASEPLAVPTSPLRRVAGRIRRALVRG